jgi:hypothetical protein
VFIFEAVMDTNKFYQLIEELHRAVPQLNPHSIKARSTYFCIVGCQLSEYLTEEQKKQLNSLIEARVIHRYVCKPPRR